MRFTNSSRFSLLLLLAFLLLALFAASCAGKSGVRFRNDRTVGEALEALTPPPGYTYYYSGPAEYPLAILGVKSGYRLQPGFWQPVDLTPARLQSWMATIDNPHRNLRTRYQSKTILDPAGEVIGIWYSPQEWTVVELGPTGEISVHTPPNTLYREISGDTTGFP